MEGVSYYEEAGSSLSHSFMHCWAMYPKSIAFDFNNTVIQRSATDRH